MNKTRINFKQLLLISSLIGLSTSCEKTPLDSTPINGELLPPRVEHNTSLANHEFNEGWFNNNTHDVYDAMFLRGFTYLDYESDGDMDVFICRPPFLNGIQGDNLDYGIIVKEDNGWVYKRDMISEQLPYYASQIRTADLDNDGDGDIVIFVADDAGNYNNGTTPKEPAGGIFAYIWEDGKYNLITIEEYIEGGNQYFYHGGTLGDVNRDGLIDIVGGTTINSVWINNGNNTFIKQTLIPDTQPWNFICSQFIFDINQDGYPDLIVGAPQDSKVGTQDFANSTHIFFGKDDGTYYNDTPDVVLENPYYYDDVSKIHACTFDISITDYDYDGDWDIFTNAYSDDSGDNSHLINYYENNNNNFQFKNIFEDTHQFYNGCSSGFMKVFDIDNDGNKEILLESGLTSVSTECSQINGYKLKEGKLQKTRI